MAPRPRTPGRIQAAGVPLVGLTAWQALFEHAGLTSGQSLLIHGAAGGVGSMAVQMAKWAGATVIATASARNHEFLRTLGADKIIDYTYRYRHEYNTILWLAAETTESLMNSLQQMADLLQLPQFQQKEQAQIVKAVQNWLGTHSKWLLICDNVEDLNLLQAVLPPLRQGAMLLTTRRQALGPLAELLELPAMDESEGAALLLRRSKRLSATTTMDLQNEPDAEKLAKLLGGLPLALDQAGAYLEETGCSVADYLQRYHQQRPLVLARRGLHGGAHPSSVTTTLQLSMERVEQEHPGAIHLLRACALLHPDAIPEELLAAEASYPGQRLQQVVTDAYQFDVMLSALRSASLIARSPEIHALSMHRLVQAVIQDQMEPTEIQLWSEHMMRVIATCFPEPDPTVWSQCERLLQSALTCLQWLETTESDLPEASELLSRVGSYLIRRGRFDEAEPLLGQAIMVTEKCYGPDHAALIPRLLQHGEALYWQGKYGRCEVVWFRALTLCKQHLGPSHVKTAETINNLALAYYGQGKYEQCEQMFYQALSIQERQLGPKSHDVASTLSNLGLLYRDQKKLEQAEKLFQQALHIFEQLFGAEEVHTIYMLNNLANVYRDQGKYEQAEPLYQQVLHAREHISGPEHPDTAITLADMAMCYREQKKYEQAERLYQQVLSLRERILGPEHPELAKTLYDFAVLREAQGKRQDAISLYQRALLIREATLDPQHPQTSETRAHMQALRQSMDGSEKATPEEGQKTDQDE